MIRINKSFILVLAALGIWGCSRGATGEALEATRLRALEARIQRMEDDLRTVTEERDQLRDQLATEAKERGQVQKQMQVMSRERNELRVQVSAHIKERDAVQVQYDRFRGEIRSLLGQADAAVSPPLSTQPLTEAPTSPAPGKS